MHPAQFPVHISVLGQPVIHRQFRAHQVTTMSSDHQSAAQWPHCVACWVDDVQKCFTDKAVLYGVGFHPQYLSVCSSRLLVSRGLGDEPLAAMRVARGVCV